MRAHGKQGWIRACLGLGYALVLGCTARSGREAVGGARRAIGPATFTTPMDTIPNFAANHTIESVADGAWSSPSTWNLNRVPGPSDVVAVSHVVTYDSTTGVADVVGIADGAALRFRTDVDTKLQVGVLLVFPSGELEVGTPSAPVAPNVEAEIVIRNRSLDLTADPDQYGTGFIGLGTVTMAGAPRTPTFVRTAQAPRAGDTSFVLEQPVSGWQVGDELVIPDSHQVATESGLETRDTAVRLEVRTVQSISADGRTIGFLPALVFDHPGPAEGNDLRPHVANLSRNIEIHSEDPAGTRGHVLFTGRAAVNISYVEFEGLGRTTFNALDPVTNHIGRYWLHMHHLYGPLPTVDPQYQFRLVGNSIYEDGPTTPPAKWGITLHDSHYGLVQDNVIYNVAGAGIVTEDGSESYNVIDHNFVARVTSNGGRDTHDAAQGIATEGVGFWFRGTNNYVRNNVAANMGENNGDVEASYAFKYNLVYLGNVNVPNFRGADTSVAGQFTVSNGNGMPILEMTDNEGYGLIQGLTIWWLCTVDNTPIPDCGQTTIRNLTIWHASRYAYYGYPTNHMVFDGLRIYSDPALLSQQYEFKSRFWFADYFTKDFRVTNSAFYNTGGVDVAPFRAGSIQYDNSFFKTLEGIVHNQGGSGAACLGCDVPDPDVLLLNNRYVAPAGFPLRSIELGATESNAPPDPNNVNRLFACNHNGVSGDNFQGFYVNSPCTTTRDDVTGGYVCVTPEVVTVCGGAPPPDTTPPTVTVTAPAGGATVSGSVNVTASASDNVGVVGVQFQLDGANLGAEDTTSPYAVSWDTSTAPSGSHVLVAVARDAAGNRTTSAAITVTVSNAPPPPVNQAPVVSAGPDQVIFRPATTTTLTGTATDDGLPASPGRLSYQWTQVAGSAGATIQSPTALSTSVILPSRGSYTFQLTVSDGALQASDTVIISVRRHR
jgi:hypothetical protein